MIEKFEHQFLIDKDDVYEIMAQLNNFAAKLNEVIDYLNRR